MDEFDDTYEQALRRRAAIRGFVNYLEKYKSRTENPTVEPLNLSSVVPRPRAGIYQKVTWLKLLGSRLWRAAPFFR
jgi:hypothetical protein